MPAGPTGRSSITSPTSPPGRSSPLDYVAPALVDGAPWPTDADFDGGDFDRFNERLRDPWAAIEPAASCGRASPTRTTGSSSSSRRLPLETIRSDAAWGWVYLVLHGHALDHLTVLEPWADQLRARQVEGDPFAVAGADALTDPTAPIAAFWAAEASIAAAVRRDGPGGRRSTPGRSPAPTDGLDAEGPRRPPGGLVRRGGRGARRPPPPTAAGGPGPRKASTPGTPRAVARDRRLHAGRGAGAVRCGPARPRRRRSGRCARRPARSGRLELGVRGPARPCPGPPRDDRPVVRRGSAWPTRRREGADGGRADDGDERIAGRRTAGRPSRSTPLTIEHLVARRAAARVPARSARSDASPTRRRPPARASCSRSRSAAGRRPR